MQHCGPKTFRNVIKTWILTEKEFEKCAVEVSEKKDVFDLNCANLMSAFNSQISKELVAMRMSTLCLSVNAINKIRVMHSNIPVQNKEGETYPLGLKFKYTCLYNK